jgi:hypothetical protein
MLARPHRLIPAPRALAVLPCVFLLIGSGCVTRWPAEVRLALSEAGDNRSELERVLSHYRAGGDEQKLKAAEFLIANMPGHGFGLAAFYDKDENEIDFDALDYPNYKEARGAIEALEKEHGEIDYGRKRFDADVETVSAELLIENIELAFQAWREKPWARDLTFEAFCEYILPYRGSNEPVNSFRSACLARYADLPQRMNNPTDAQEAARLIRKDVHQWVRFSELYYLHPTDQSFDEMNQRRLGRCEDISNMMMYAMRANAIPSVSDYTPWWADRDNNHAWEVTLDAEGCGQAGLSNRAAKVYRKVFAIQRDSLACRKLPKEKVPRWLRSKNYKDVTDQYLDTTDVTIRLQRARPENARFAYVCVFNGGEWRVIHWGEIDGDQVTFTKMGRNIACLPAYYVDEQLVPAAPPFILTREGAVRMLAGEAKTQLAIQIAATAPETADADTHTNRPTLVVKPGKTYELFVWNDGWVSQGKRVAGDQPVSFASVPAGRLLWLVEEDSRRLERIFTIDAGRQAWW